MYCWAFYFPLDGARLICESVLSTNFSHRHLRLGRRTRASMSSFQCQADRLALIENLYYTGRWLSIAYLKEMPYPMVNFIAIVATQNVPFISVTNPAPTIRYARRSFKAVAIFLRRSSVRWRHSTLRPDSMKELEVRKIDQVFRRVLT